MNENDETLKTHLVTGPLRSSHPATTSPTLNSVLPRNSTRKYRSRLEYHLTNTVGTEEISIKYCEAEDVLGDIFDQELHASIPVRVTS